MEEERLTKGMKFPPEPDPATGRFRTCEGEESIRQALYLILMTQKTERLARPEFGSETLSYTFTDTAPTMLHLIEHRLLETIITQEPRVADVNVSVEKRDLEEEMYIYIDYTIRENHQKAKMAFPFPFSGGVDV